MSCRKIRHYNLILLAIIMILRATVSIEIIIIIIYFILKKQSNNIFYCMRCSLTAKQGNEMRKSHFQIVLDSQIGICHVAEFAIII